MLWSYSEVVAYIHESEDDIGVPIPQTEIQKNDVLCASTVSPRSSFGGFQTWPSSKLDFILIAENSEIHGPNPLFTIPPSACDVTYLNWLCTQILSADYQGLSNNKNIAGKNAQLLMPDLTSDIHAAINHFILFDSEARGFVRPICLAYITSDKNKLISLAKPILKGLNEAALFIQHSNVMYCREDFEKLLKDLKRSKNVNNVNGHVQMEFMGASSQANKRFCNESVFKDIEDILNVMESFKLHDFIENAIISFLKRLVDCGIAKEMKNIPSMSSSLEKCQPEASSSPTSPCKHLKPLLFASPGGILMGLYHLHVLLKHFQRKFEILELSSNNTASDVGFLNFGACIRSSKSDEHYYSVKCCVDELVTPSLSFRSSNYMDCLDSNFKSLLLEFSNSCERDVLPVKLIEMQQKMTEMAKGVLCSIDNDSGHIVQEQRRCRHIMNLDTIWDSLDSPAQQLKDAESFFLQVLKLFHQTDNLLLALFTRIPIVVICSPEELPLAQSFVTAIATFVPRTNTEDFFVELYQKEPLNRESIRKIAAAVICLCDLLVIEDFIPPELLSIVCVLNLRDNSFTGPRYSGCLLSGVDDRFKALPPDGPAYSVLISILSEVEQSALLWRRIASSSLGDSEVTGRMQRRGFTTCDVSIVQKLSMLINNER